MDLTSIRNFYSKWIAATCFNEGSKRATLSKLFKKKWYISMTLVNDETNFVTHFIPPPQKRVKDACLLPHNSVQ